MTDNPEMVEPEWLNDACPGGLPWTSCRADECGVLDDGTGCELATPGSGGA